MCGARIYAFLAVSDFHWRMLASEVWEASKGRCSLIAYRGGFRSKLTLVVRSMLYSGSHSFRKLHFVGFHSAHLTLSLVMEKLGIGSVDDAGTPLVQLQTIIDIVVNAKGKSSLRPSQC